MGICICCGNSVGLFRSYHAECVQKQKLGLSAIENIVVEAFTGIRDYKKIEFDIRSIVDSSFVLEAQITDIYVRTWERVVNNFLDEGCLDENEEQRLIDLIQYFDLSTTELNKNGAITKCYKGSILRNLMNGIIRSEEDLDGLPFNFQKNEQPIWLFTGVDFLEDKIRRQFVGGSSGVSVRIMKGLYYRVGAFKGESISRTERVHVDTGLLCATNKHIYFHGPRKSFRVPFTKIVSFTPYRDGIGIVKDSASAMPQTFITNDGWFTYNLITNLAHL
jgi:hypothetical protein